MGSSVIGQTIPQYRTPDHLGGSGRGVSYKAQGLRLTRTVALKFLPPDLSRDSEAT